MAVDDSLIGRLDSGHVPAEILVSTLFSDLPVYADNAAALLDNAAVGSLYKTLATGDATVGIVNAT